MKSKFMNNTLVFICGIGIGYTWCYYHHTEIRSELKKIKFEQIEHISEQLMLSMIKPVNLTLNKEGKLFWKP